MITGFVVALPEEVRTLTAKKIAKGQAASIADDCIIAYSGTGIDNAQLAAEKLVTLGATQLVSWGCAAALDPTLTAGTLVLPSELVGADQAILNTDTDWLSHTVKKLQPHLTLNSGSLAESKVLVATRAEKATLHINTNAVAVDMESIAIAKVAKKHSLPFLAIRAIADPADMNLPKAIGASLNQQGEVELSKLLLFLALHPGELPGLIKLGLHFNSAQKTLKQVAELLNAINQFQIADPAQ